MTVTKLMDEDSYHIDRDTLDIYESLLNTELLNDSVTTINVEPVNAERYKGDFFGLLHNVYQLPNFSLYLITRLNGFKSSLEYEGSLQIKIFNDDAISAIIDYINELNVVRNELNIVT